MIPFPPQNKSQTSQMGHMWQGGSWSLSLDEMTERRDLLNSRVLLCAGGRGETSATWKMERVDCAEPKAPMDFGFAVVVRSDQAMVHPNLCCFQRCIVLECFKSYIFVIKEFLCLYSCILATKITERVRPESVVNNFFRLGAVMTHLGLEAGAGCCSHSLCHSSR